MSQASLRIVEATNKYRDRTINAFYFEQQSQLLYLKRGIENYSLSPTKIFNIKEMSSFSNAEKIPFKEILGLSIYKTRILPSRKHSFDLYVLSLFTKDKSELVVDENTDLLKLRELGEKIAKYTQSVLKVSFGGNAGQFFSQNDLTRTYTELDTPYIKRLKDRVEDGKVFIYKDTDFEDINYNVKFVDNTNTAFISYKIPYLFTGKFSLIVYGFLWLVSGAIINIILLELGILPETVGPTSPFIVALALTPYLASLFGLFYLFRYCFFYDAEFLINDYYLKYRDKSIFGKTEFEFDILKLEEILVEKRPKNEAFDNNMIDFSDHSKFYFISDEKICELCIPEEQAVTVKNALNRACLSAAESFCERTKAE